MYKLKIFTFLIFTGVLAASGIPAHAAGSGITYHGRILNPDGTPVTDNHVIFLMQILTPDSQGCLMYAETQWRDLSATAGTFSITINDGTGSRTDSSGYQLDRIFGNYGTFSFVSTACTGGSGTVTWSPNAGDGRSFLVSFKTSSMSSYEDLPVQGINFVPMAIEAKQVAGFPGASLLRVEGGSGPQSVSSLTPTQAANLVTLANGSSTQYVQSGSNGAGLPSFATDPSSPTAGDVWYDSTNKIVKYYDGTSSQAISATLPSVGTAGTYTKVTTDAQGRVTAGAQITGDDITSGTIQGSTAINSTGNITLTGGATVSSTNITSTSDSTNNLNIWDGTSHKVTVTAPSGLAADYALTLPTDEPASSGMALVSTSAGVLSWAPIGTGNGDFMKDGSVTMTGPLKMTPAALPGSPVAGEIVFDSTASNALKFYNGTSWQTVGTGGGSGDFMKDGSVAMTGNLKLGANYISNDGGASEGLAFDTSGNANFTGKVGIGTTSPNSDLSFGGSANRTIAMERNTSVATGYDLTVQAGGGGAGTDISGGDLNLNGGNATGNGSSQVRINVTNAGQGSGSTVRTPATTIPIATFDGGYRSVAIGEGAISQGWYSTLISLDGSTTYTGTQDNSMVVMGGNVGIGTITPKQLLDVNGPIHILPAALPGTPTAGVLAFDSGASNALKYYNGSAWQTVGTGTGSGDFMKDGSVTMTGNLKLGANYISNDGGPTEGLAFDTSGNANFTGKVGIGTSAATSNLSFSGQAAQTIGMERASSSTGQSLTIKAGSAKSGSSNQNGGDLYLQSGVATGGGSSTIHFQISDTGAASTTDNDLFDAFTLDYNGGWLHYWAYNSNNWQNGLLIENSNNTSIGGGALTLAHSYNGAGGVGAGDILGQIDFRGYTNNTGRVLGAQIRSNITSITTNQDKASITFATNKAGTLTDQMIIDWGGNVGIGTMTPSQLLDVNGPIHILPATLPSSPTAGVLAFDSGASNALKYYNGTAWQTVGTGSGSGDFMKDGSVAMTGNLKLGANYISNDGGASEGLAFDTSGNANFTGKVGIGTTSPSAPVHVVSTVAANPFGLSANDRVAAVLSSTPPTGGTNYLVLGNNIGTGNWSNFISFNSGASSKWILGNDMSSAGVQTFSLYDMVAGSTRFYVNSSGNVGIGTTNPLQTLDVNGPVHITPTALPGSPTAGVLAFDSGASNALKFYNGSSWQTVGTGTGNGNGDFMKDGSVSMTGNFNAGGNKILGNTTASANLTLESTSDSTKGNVILQPTAGNVGIGTTTTTATLTIKEGSANGGMTIKGTTGVNSGNADFNLITSSANGQWNIAASNSAGNFAIWDTLNSKGPLTIEPNAAANSLYLKSGGNVGIGTTTPVTNLEVVGGFQVTKPAANQAAMATLNGDETAYSETRYMTANNGSTYWRVLALGDSYSSNPGVFQIRRNASTALVTILPGGNIGFGTVSPSYPLDIAGTANSTLYTNIQNSSTGTTAYSGFNAKNDAGAAVTMFIGGSGATATNAGVSAANLAIVQSSAAATGGLLLNASASAPVVFGTANAERMRIDSGGNVGIGTTAPVKALDVNGQGQIKRLYLTDDIATGGGAHLGINRSDNTKQTYIMFSDANVQKFLIGTPSGSNNLSFTNSGGGNFMFPGGSVGIGTTSPSYKLDVTGDVNATGCVRASGSSIGGTCSSDERLKTDIQPFDLGLDALLGISPKTFRYNGLGEHPASDKPELGVIAQDVEKTAPQLIVNKQVKLHPDDQQTVEIKQVNYTAFTYVLINAVKDLYHSWFNDSQEIHRELASIKAENDQLKSDGAVKDQKIDLLEKENSAIKAYLCDKDPNASICH